MQIFELYSAIGTTVLTKWIGRTKTPFKLEDQTGTSIG